MIIKILPFIAIIGLIGCTNPVTVDYFGQTEPTTIPEKFGEGEISQKGRLEYGISFTPDGRELVFGILNKDDFSGEIYYSKKVDDHWSSPEIFKPLENKSVFLPYFSPNGKSLVFTQSKWDTALYHKDIWIIKKNNQTWKNPKKMKLPINPLASVSNACMTADGTVFFSSNINCIGKENCHTADLFYSKKAGNDYQNVKVISEFISSNDEESVYVSPKEEYIIFCRYTDNKSWMDLYISYRDINNKWTEPRIVDSTINSKDWDRRPFVSIDNKFLFFTRSQINENWIMTESGIYWVNTAKLFKPFIYNSISDTTIQIGEKFELSIPIDYYKDIDDEQLTLSINNDEFDWIEFDSEKMKLTGLPTLGGDFQLTITAVDKQFNKTMDKIKIKVIK